jgi:hypothetical protein
VSLNARVINRATDAYVAAYRHVADGHGPGGSFDGPTADDIIAAEVNQWADPVRYRAYETVVVERAREKLGIGAPKKARLPRGRCALPLTDEERAEIIALREDGLTYGQIRTAVGRGHEAIARVLKDAGLAGRMRA